VILSLPAAAVSANSGRWASTGSSRLPAPSLSGAMAMGWLLRGRDSSEPSGQEIAALTSSATFFSAAGLHSMSAYDTGHTAPSSRFAESWKPRVE